MKLDYLTYVIIIIVGFFVALGVLGKLFFGFNIESDWFWFLTGVGLAFEGVVSFRKQKKFDRKYKIIE